MSSEEPKLEGTPLQDSKPSAKGQFSARGGRGGGASKVRYVKKGETGEEEQKDNKDYKRYKGDRRNKQEKDKEREKITLETVIPEKPKKHEVLKEPSEEEYFKQLNELDDKIDQIFDKMHKYNNEIRDTKNKNKNNKDSMPLRDLLTTKISESRRINEELRGLRTQFNDKKNLIEDLHAKSQKYRQKLKKYFKKEEIEEELRKLIDQQNKGNITLQQEKLIIKEIAELERSLPFATPLELVTKEMEEAYVEKKKLGDQMSVLYVQREAIQKDIDELKTDIDNRKKEKDDVLKNLDPLLESKKVEYYAEVDALKEQKHKIKEKYSKDYDDYYKQQNLLQQIEWMTKIKNRLRREEERKKREEEDKKLEEEEKKDSEKFNPHQDDINLCDLLINYAQNLLPKTSVSVVLEKKVEINQSAQDEWKKEKITVIQSKKDNDGDYFAPKGKKKREVKKKEEPVNEKQALNHQFEVMGYFEKLKVAPPLSVSRLEETIKLLREKREYFAGLPLTDVVVVGENKNEEKEERKPNENNKRGNRQGIEMNENDFPTI